MATAADVEAKLLIEVSGVQIVQVKLGTDASRSVLGTAPLQVLSVSEDMILLFAPELFQYALMKGVSGVKAMRASSHVFVFPAGDELCFGVSLPTHTPAADLELFVGLLAEYSDLSSKVDSEIEEESDADSVADDDTVADADTADDSTEARTRVGRYGFKAAGYLKKGSAAASAGIAKGTGATVARIRKAKETRKRKITDRKQVEVSKKTRERIKKAKSATAKGVTVSGKVLDTASAATAHAAHATAAAASRTGIGRRVGGKMGGEKTAATKAVARGVIVGVLDITEQLEAAASTILSEVADSSTELAQHKYGDDVGEVAADSVEIVKGAHAMVSNVTGLAPTALVEHMVVESTVAGVSTAEQRAEMKEERSELIGSAKSHAETAAVASKAKGSVALSKVKGWRSPKLSAVPASDPPTDATAPEM